MKVSVLILTLNEEDDLPRCLDSLRWCDDVLVLDSGSSDRTLSIAREWGARVLEHDFENFASQRNYGLQFGGLRHEWVLHLDADEVVTEALSKKLAHLSPSDQIDAYRIPAKAILFGRWLRWSSMYPTYQVRLGHRDQLRFKQVGHGQREELPPRRVATIDEPYLHFAFSKGLKHWLTRHVKYAADEAAEIVVSRSGPPHLREAPQLPTSSTDRRRLLKSASNRLPLTIRPFARFGYVYFWRLGFLDGTRGALYSAMLATYEAMVAIMVAESRWRSSAARKRSAESQLV